MKAEREVKSINELFSAIGIDTVRQRVECVKGDSLGFVGVGQCYEVTTDLSGNLGVLGDHGFVVTKTDAQFIPVFERYVVDVEAVYDVIDTFTTDFYLSPSQALLIAEQIKNCVKVGTGN